jgi:hypothetical protein
VLFLRPTLPQTPRQCLQAGEEVALHGALARHVHAQVVTTAAIHGPQPLKQQAVGLLWMDHVCARSLAALPLSRASTLSLCGKGMGMAEPSTALASDLRPRHGEDGQECADLCDVTRPDYAVQFVQFTTDCRAQT